jgi:hypothetical protein
VTAAPNCLEDLRAGDLTTDELSHLLANRRAVEAAGPPPAMEWEQRPRTVEDKAYRFARYGRSIGVDEDLIECNLLIALAGEDYTREDATAVLRDAGVGVTHG